jgi:hypothetical protein
LVRTGVPGGRPRSTASSVGPFRSGASSVTTAGMPHAVAAAARKTH